MTNYERYFGTPERAYATMQSARVGIENAVTINLHWCGTCEDDRCGGRCDQQCDKHRIEWLNEEASVVVSNEI